MQARLRSAIDRINPAMPPDARDDAFRKAVRTAFTTVIDNNEAFHTLLTDGVDVKFGIGEGRSKSDKVRLIDFDNPNNNDFLAVNQFAVIENHNNKRPDIVIFINGLPLVVIELKNPADENADVQAAFSQLQTYQQLIPSLFTYNAFLVISDGWFAKIGTISSDYSRFMDWKSTDGKTIVDAKHQSELEPMITGFSTRRPSSMRSAISLSLRRPKKQRSKRLLPITSITPSIGPLLLPSALPWNRGPLWLSIRRSMAFPSSDEQAQGQAGRCHLAYAGQRQESFHGVLCGQARACGRDE